MFILMSILLGDVDFKSVPLDSVKNQWAVGVRVFGCDRVILEWNPTKTVAIGVTGYINSQGTNNEYETSYDSFTYDSKRETWRVGIGFLKYFMSGGFISPFIGLSPYFEDSYSNDKYIYESGDTTKYDRNNYTFGLTLSPGAEYFFKLEGKQLSAKLIASLVDLSREYKNYSSHYSSTPGNDEDNSGATNYLSFTSPTDISVSVYLMLHF